MAKIIKPNSIGGIKATIIDELGSNTIAAAATMAPPSINGKRRPSLFQVRSDAAPTIGCTSKPIIGAANQNNDSDDRSAPKSDKIRLTLPFCSAKPICTPRKPKLRFQNCQKESLGCFITGPRIFLFYYDAPYVGLNYTIAAILRKTVHTYSSCCCTVLALLPAIP